MKSFLPYLQPYKYNGKEYIEDFGYDCYAYGFRDYYATIGRFTSIDPMAESSYSKSTYAYASNNFAGEIDFMGLFSCSTSTQPTFPVPTSSDDWGGFLGSGDFGSLQDILDKIMGNKGSGGVLGGMLGGGGFGGIMGGFGGGIGACNLTVVNGNGEIIYHDPYSSDYNVYLTNDDNWTIADGVDGLGIIGIEFDFNSASDKAAFYQVGKQLSWTDYSVMLADEVVAVAYKTEPQKSNAAKNVLAGGSVIALGISQIDGPLIPIADIAAVIFEAGVLVVAGGIVVYDIVQWFREHDSNQRPSNWDKHTEPRPGRNNTKNRQNPKWKPNPNKR